MQELITSGHFQIKVLEERSQHIRASNPHMQNIEAANPFCLSHHLGKLLKAIPPWSEHQSFSKKMLKPQISWREFSIPRTRQEAPSHLQSLLSRELEITTMQVVKAENPHKSWLHHRNFSASWYDYQHNLHQLCFFLEAKEVKLLQKVQV